MRSPALVVYWLLPILAWGDSLPFTKRQEKGYVWSLIGYSQRSCKGEVVASWRGSSYVPRCIQIDQARSIAGGSGNGVGVNVWQDTNCTVPAPRLELSGQDENKLPCYNTAVRSFSLMQT
ncbi:hypothetical protein QBC37DRAFT_428537 [Rhypophila decipiens]|uniref:Uncharacterized protein n=1 Tax=Rhypophila decipiens TaxID=261697 RepID=A0AAN7B753_9PEZI|nr:hypothetical protein QBC37DRAFT_428537 [Rhypophila decipiens]